MLQNGWSVEAAQAGHVNRIANRMRAVDVLECRAMGHTPKYALDTSRRLSIWACTIMYKGQPVAMFGLVVTSLLAGVGKPWMLGTDALGQAMRDLVKVSPRVVASMQRETPMLENHVAVENRRSIMYLRHLGFAFDPEPVTIGGVPMLRFSKGF